MMTPLPITADHADQVHRILTDPTAAPEVELIVESWRRSTTQFGIDPTSSAAPRILTMRELEDHRGSSRDLVATAQPELDRLYELVRDAGYVVLFCDPKGVAIDHRGDDGLSSLFRYWGVWLGGVWSEAAEGTNGIGTCILERRPVTVHRTQHYRARHIGLSCSGAPIVDDDGSLRAVIDVSAIDPALSEHAHALTGVLTTNAARAIEERVFRKRFRAAWIVAVASSETAAGAALLAIDDDWRIVGADRRARRSFALDDRPLADGVGLWRLFERNLAPFRRRTEADRPALLASADGDQVWRALITAPERVAGSRSALDVALYTRPRSPPRDLVRLLAPAPRACGGLAPLVLGRVIEHVDAHLGETTRLGTLARIAGLSVFHFAREFKRATGETPHGYILKQRVARAERLLRLTDLSVSAVALAAGFSDPSHLTRRFREIVGVTPRVFRRSHRQ
jgi:transcriptional regulator of acetoin/glycerol metabolism/AraC-like DNA-binding protein